MLAHLKRANRLEAEVLKVREDLQAEIHRLQAMAAEAERLAGEKTTESESLRGALRKEEFVLAGLKAAQTLEEEEKKEARAKVAELEAQMVKSISEAAAQAVEEFNASSEMKDLNIAFSQKAFIKGFELCEGMVARRFSELDLGFLEGEEETGEEAEPSSAAANPSFAEPVVEVPELATESTETARGADPAAEAPEPAESAPTSSAAAPSEVEDL